MTYTSAEVKTAADDVGEIKDAQLVKAYKAKHAGVNKGCESHARCLFLLSSNQRATCHTRRRSLMSFGAVNT
eukprot:scaffold54196_cov40-Prasinocladus_malaysianus.AAC.4